MARVIPLRPPAAWFENPRFERLSPLAVTSEGRVLGHLAGWGTCHTGYPDQCVTAPHSKSGYAFYRLGTVECDDDTIVEVGTITMHTGHAPLAHGATRTRAHYDDTGTAVADVAAGDDEHGPWLAGALRPDTSDEDRRALSAAKLSGDWRRVDDALELLAVLAVNVPGFPIPRARVASGEPSSVLAMVAAGRVVRDMDATTAARQLRVLHARAQGRDALHKLAAG